MATDVVLAAAVRTPIGRFGGGLLPLSAVEIGAHVMRASLERAGVEPEVIDEVIVGHARQANNGPNPGRLMAITAGLPHTAHTHTVQQACVSSMKAVMLAAQSIVLGDAQCVMVAGVEHMSSIPFFATDVRWGRRMGDSVLIDGLSRDGFKDPLTGEHMGALADEWTTRFGLDRDAQDAFALRSQQRAAEAARDGFAARTIAPVTVPARRGETVVEADEHPRPDSTMEGLARLEPVFVKNGSVTAGNASGITDGAVAMIVASADAAERLGLHPIARLLSWAVRGLEPENYGLAVVPASQASLERAGLGVDDMDVIEINEAFAVQVLASCQLLGIDAQRVNLRGGAIALGHPVGMSGARIVQYAAECLQDTNRRYALATICGNGGHGGAVVLERA
jgi:acetyl-CoA C-acetyltransferase